MRKTVFVLGCAALVAFFPVSSAAADAIATQGNPDNPDVALTPKLLQEIQKNRYANTSVQTTNGNIVGIYADVINDSSGKPSFFVMQTYDNVSPTKDFVAAPWELMRFDQQNRRIEMATTENHLRKAPKFDRPRLDAIKRNPDEIAKLQQSMGTALGGGAVAATMGTQSGEGSSSSLNRIVTNDAQPQRGSVGMMYILGIVAAAIVAIALLARRRA